MNVASPELCKELVERSYWLGTTFSWYLNEAYDDEPALNLSDSALVIGGVGYHDKQVPAYDLGILLRRLPQYISVDGEMRPLELHPLARDSAKWAIGYMKGGLFSSEWHTVAVADAPEDCAAKLAIELFKQGILSEEVR